MDNRDYDEALARLLAAPLGELEKYIKLEFENSNEKPVFYSKILESGNKRLIQDCQDKPDHWNKVKAYCERKARGGIKLDSNPNDLEAVLKDALTVDKFNSPAVLRGYYLLTNNKSNFYSGILKLFEDKKEITRSYVHKGDAIREFCKTQLEEHSFWKRNDYANTKWIATSLFALLGVVISFLSYQKKSEKTPPIIIEHNFPAVSVRPTSKASNHIHSVKSSYSTPPAVQNTAGLPTASKTTIK